MGGAALWCAFPRVGGALSSSSSLFSSVALGRLSGVHRSLCLSVTWKFRDDERGDEQRLEQRWA